MPDVLFLDRLTALVPAPPGAAIFRRDRAATMRASLAEARALFQSGEALVAHAAFVAGRLGIPPAKPLFDVLELFAFVRPGRPLVPSPLGLARALGLKAPHTPEEAARSLYDIARALLDEAAAMEQQQREALSPLIGTMTRAGWRWGPLLQSGEASPHGSPIAGLEA